MKGGTPTKRPRLRSVFFRIFAAKKGDLLDEVDCLLLWGLALGVQDHPEVVVLLQEGLVLRPERVPQ